MGAASVSVSSEKAPHIGYIDPLRFLLLAGVVLIHSSMWPELGLEEAGNAGVEITTFVSSQLMSVCVPSFYILSGYLFFYRCGRLTPDVYVRKLKRRVRTLLVPYLIWNLFCCALFLIKAGFLGFPGQGIIKGGDIDFGHLLEGFLFRPQADYYPYAFAFWFIRNLILYVVMAPLVGIAVSRRWLAVAVVAALALCQCSLASGMAYFTIGAAMARGRVDMQSMKMRQAAFSCALLLLFVLSIIDVYPIPYALRACVLVFKNIIGFAVMLNIAIHLEKFRDSGFFATLMSSTFFIYAFHQCFCTVVRKLWISLLPVDGTPGAIAAYLLSFATMVAVSLAVYMLLKRLSPSFTGLITGGRA